jgi:collagen type VI alpha
VVLKDSGGDHLVYIPSQMLEPQKLVNNHKKDQKIAEPASLVSGKEMKDDGNF